MRKRQSPRVLFDGDCGVCSAAASLAHSIDRRGRFVIAPFQVVSDEELREWGIDRGSCGRRLRVASAGGRVYSGAFGVNYFLWKQPWWRILPTLIYALPPLLLLELLGYELVARNRETISRWLGLEACLNTGG